MSAPRKDRRCLDRWWVIHITQPLSTFAFMGGAWLAGRTFPSPFDWHHVVVSALQSPRDNPLGYHWFAFGIALSGLLLLPLRDHLACALAPFSPRGARAIRQLLAIGILGMVLVAVFTHRPAVYPRLHENLALLAYVTLVLALLATTLLFMRHPEATRLAEGNHRRWSFSLLALAIFGPLLAAASTQLVLYLFPAIELQWTDPSGQPGGAPPYLSLAFWEWIVSVLLYTGAWILAWLATPANAQGSEATSQVKAGC